MFCENCGKSVPENSPACGYCGQTFTAQTASAVSSRPSTSSGYTNSQAPNPYAAPYTSPSRPVGPNGGASPYGSTNPYSNYQYQDSSAPRTTRINPLLVLPMFRWLLQGLENGKVIRTGVTLVLRILATVTALGGIILLLETLKFAFNLPGTATLGGLVAAAGIAVTTFAMFQILLYRATSVSKLGDSEFTVIPIFSYLFRAAGECDAAFAVGIGVTGCLFTWLTGISPERLMPLIPGVPGLSASNNSFLFGLSFLGLMLLLAFIALVGFYFCAELVLIAADISRNVGKIAKVQTGTEPAR
jgi:hypothetical protein